MLLYWWTTTLQIEVMLLRLHDSADKTYGTCPVPWLEEHAQNFNLNAFLSYI